MCVRQWEKKARQATRAAGDVGKNYDTSKAKPLLDSSDAGFEGVERLSLRERLDLRGERNDLLLHQTDIRGVLSNRSFESRHSRFECVEPSGKLSAQRADFTLHQLVRRAVLLLDALEQHQRAIRRRSRLLPRGWLFLAGGHVGRCTRP
ncbi:MAG: hypothetical protein ACJ790_19165 [Myxococcaceae bacterium]